jgi:acyl-coenzyme A synthetase/AMP-(fatty) acid ligase
MLYLRWLETSRRFAAHPAVYAGGAIVTFGELARAVELSPVTRKPVTARSGGPAFFIDILRAWRDGQAVIPIEKDSPEPVLARPPLAETRLVKHTPGASGVPRGIFLNEAQIMADAEQIVATMGLSPEVPNLAVISPAHSYGFSNIVLPLLFHGVPAHFAAVPFPRVIEGILSQHSEMIVPAVPPMWRAWHRSGILRNAPIRLAISAGAPLPLALEHEVFADSALKIHNFYGASECGGIAFDAESTPRECGTFLGKALRGVTVRETDDGRLRVSSLAVASCYDEAREDDELCAGSYLTRDLGYTDENRSVYLTGTTGSAINVAGRKVSPAKVEAALLATGLLKWVRVFGIPSSDPERFEEIAAEVELMPGVRMDRLKSAATQQLRNWELPRHWR